MRNPQFKLLKDQPKAYGGELLKTRKGRSHGRPLDTKKTMHLVLRSSKAVGPWSFWKPNNKTKITGILKKFSARYGVKVLSMANVGNHLHLQIKLANRFTYAPFIRAITGAIAMAISGKNRWTAGSPKERWRFWDYRPFTRVIIGFRNYLNLRNYIEINRLEGFGMNRNEAQFFLKWTECKSPP